MRGHDARPWALGLLWALRRLRRVHWRKRSLKDTGAPWLTSDPRIQNSMIRPGAKCSQSFCTNELLMVQKQPLGIATGEVISPLRAMIVGGK